MDSSWRKAPANIQTSFRALLDKFGLLNKTELEPENRKCVFYIKGDATRHQATVIGFNLERITIVVRREEMSQKSTVIVLPPELLDYFVYANDGIQMVPRLCRWRKLHVQRHLHPVPVVVYVSIEEADVQYCWYYRKHRTCVYEGHCWFFHEAIVTQFQ